jgi:putative glutamine amidotransferase
MQNGPSLGGGPVVGVCAALEPARWSFWAQEAALVAETYLHAVRRGGGLPIVLAPQELRPAETDALLDRVAGLLLIGGAEVDPRLTVGRRPRGVGRRRRGPSAPCRCATGSSSRSRAGRSTATSRCSGSAVACRSSTSPPAAACASTVPTRASPTTGRRLTGSTAGPRTTSRSTPRRSSAPPLAGRARPSIRIITRASRGSARAPGSPRAILDGLVEALEWPAQRYASVQWHPEAVELGATIAGSLDAAVDRPAPVTTPA